MSELHPRTAMRCSACGNIGMTSIGLEMQDKINKLQQELEAARADIHSRMVREKNLRDDWLEARKQFANAKAEIERLQSRRNHEFCNAELADALAQYDQLKKDVGVDIQKFKAQIAELLENWKAADLARMEQRKQITDYEAALEKIVESVGGIRSSRIAQETLNKWRAK